MVISITFQRYINIKKTQVFTFTYVWQLLMHLVFGQSIQH